MRLVLVEDDVEAGGRGAETTATGIGVASVDDRRWIAGASASRRAIGKLGEAGVRPVRRDGRRRRCRFYAMLHASERYTVYLEYFHSVVFVRHSKIPV